MADAPKQKPAAPRNSGILAKPSAPLSGSEAWNLFKSSKLVHPYDRAMAIIEKTPEFIAQVPEMLRQLGLQVTPANISKYGQSLAATLLTRGPAGLISRAGISTIPAGVRAATNVALGVPPGSLEEQETGIKGDYAKEGERALAGLTYASPQGRKLDFNAIGRYIAKNPEAPAWAVAKLVASAATAGESAALVRAIEAAEANAPIASTAWKTAAMALKRGVKPAAITTAWLAQPGVELAGSAPVRKLASKLVRSPNIFEAEAYSKTPKMSAKDLGKYQYSPEMLKLFEEAGIDPSHYQGNVAKQVINQTLAADGFSPQSLKTAVVRVATIPEDATAEQIRLATSSKINRPTHAMMHNEPHPRGGIGPQVQQDLNRAIDEQHGAHQDQISELINRNYGSSVRDNGVFIHPDFGPGLKEAIDKALYDAGHPSIEQIVSNPGNTLSQRMLLGVTESGVRKPGLLEKIAEFSPQAEAAPAAPVKIKMGSLGDFIYKDGEWKSAANGNPVQGALSDALNEQAKVKGIDLTPSVTPPRAKPTVYSLMSSSEPQNFFDRGTKASLNAGNAGPDLSMAYTIRDATENYMRSQEPYYTGDLGASLESAIAGRNYAKAYHGDYSFLPDEYKPRAGQLQTARDIVNAPDTAPLGDISASAQPPSIAKKLAIRAASAAGATVNPFLAITTQHLMEEALTPKGPTEYMRYPRATVQVPASARTAVQAAAALNNAGPNTPQTAPPPPAAPAQPSQEELARFYEGQQAQKPTREATPQEPSQEELKRIFEAQQPQPQYRGGRAAYKSGGKVGHDIEPLVRYLVNKAHKVKKMSNKATEPLLNQHDNAIATALEAAQKAI